MRKPVLIALALIAAALVAARMMDLTGDDSPLPATDIPENEKPGGYRDQHGCLPSGGYEWDAQKQKCVRPWEE